MNNRILSECRSERCWLGATDLEVEGRWIWSGDGSLATIGNWKKGTPDNGMGMEEEDCMYMYGQEYGGGDQQRESLRGQWNDKGCQHNLDGFVCQRSSNYVKYSECRGYRTQLECPATATDSERKRRGRRRAEGVSKQPLCKAVSDVRARGQAANLSMLNLGVIGDYGLVEGGCEKKVMRLMKNVQMMYGDFDLLLSTGDNAYWSGTCASYNQSVLPFLSSMFPISTKTCNDSTPLTHMDDGQEIEIVPTLPNQKEINQAIFFPSIGNHDWRPALAAAAAAAEEATKEAAKEAPTIPTIPTMSTIPYFQTFPHVAALDWYRQQQSNAATMMGGDDELIRLQHGGFYRYLKNEHVEIFVLNSNLGILSGGSGGGGETFQELHVLQSQWLHTALLSSSATFKIVIFHHPPYSTAAHDPPALHMRYPFHEWGVDLVLTGHQHVYERMEIKTVTHVINGLGGHHWTYEIDQCRHVVNGSKKRYNQYHGLMYGVITNNELAFCFYSIENEVDGSLVDEFIIPAQR